jgi:fructose-1,6-bisphosphatase/inositol monophosphatase family enzyme
MARDLSRALAVAIAAAREAGELLRSDLHRPGGPRGEVDKADADTEAEQLIRARLLGELPGASFVGEETGRVAAAPASRVARGPERRHPRLPARKAR